MGLPLYQPLPPLQPTPLKANMRLQSLNDNYRPGQTLNFQRFKQLQLLGGFPLDRGRLSPCHNQDLDNYCPVIRTMRQGPLTRQDLKEKFDCIHDTSTASVNDEPPPPHAGTKPITRIPLSVQSEQEVAIPLRQPWPPHVAIVPASPMDPIRL